MKITVTAKTKARAIQVERVNESDFTVRVKELPESGRANAAIVKALANYFSVPQSNVRIVSGLRGRVKIVEILENP